MIRRRADDRHQQPVRREGLAVADEEVAPRGNVRLVSVILVGSGVALLLRR